MANEKWLIILDRYGNESKAKNDTGEIFTLIDTANLIIKEYEQSRFKPEIDVCTVGIGMALADYLESKNIPINRITSLLHRTGNADIYKSKILKKEWQNG